MDEPDDTQGLAYQQQLEQRQWIDENGGDPNSQRDDSNIDSYENIRGE